MRLDPLGDGISSVEMLPIKPSDLTVVNAARVSMHKFHDKIDMEKDKGLINYLAKHDHWTPFSHVQYLLERIMNKNEYIDWVNKSTNEQFARSIVQIGSTSVRFFERGSLFAFLKNGIVTDTMKSQNPLSVQAFDMMDKITDSYLVADYTPKLSEPDSMWWKQNVKEEDVDKLQVASFRIKMPIFIARQWYKHQIGFTRNEVSRRYVADTPDFFIPNEWRLRADNVKQGSSDDIHEYSGDMQGWISDATFGMLSKYNELIETENVCPEQSRSVLPQSMYTEFVETASLNGYNRLIGLRTDPHAQYEVRKYAESIQKHLTTT